MKVKLMQLPRSVLVGKGVIENVCEVLKGVGLQGSGLVVVDETTLQIAGNKVKELIARDHPVKSIVISDATSDEVQRVQTALERDGCSFALGLGGGRVIDVTKLASKNHGVEFVSIPTAAAHDGIASSRASIRRDGNTVSIGADAPIAIIADTDIIQKAPYRLLASGCGDILSKYTSVKDWELGRDKKREEYSEYAAALSLMSAEIIMGWAGRMKSGGEESVRKVVKALISCGVAMSIAGSSRPASGSEHKFSHTLDSIAPEPALHGEQCGVGSIMMMKLQEGDWKKQRAALKAIEAPTTARELGIRDEHIVSALVNAKDIRPERYTILDEADLNEKEAEKLARETGVIR